MSAANQNSVLTYLETKRAQYGGRACSIPQDTIAAALGVSTTLVREMLEQLKERGKVHEVSRGSWCTGAGFGR